MAGKVELWSTGQVLFVVPCLCTRVWGGYAVAVARDAKRRRLERSIIARLSQGQAIFWHRKTLSGAACHQN